MNITYTFLKVLSRFACILSESGAEKMGKILGDFFWLLVPPKRKKISRENILRAGITKDRAKAESISKSAALRFGSLGVSMLRFPLLTKENISNYVIIRNKEHLDNILKDKKGCILAANHC